MTSFFTACCPLPTAHYLRCFLVVAIAATLLANSSVALAQGGRGRHERAFAVSRPGDVKIDAKLDDWDLSGQIWIYVSQETSEQKSAKFAMMYDDEALYLSGDVRDPTPMMNRHDPKVSASKAWDADAFQFRIILDPAQGFPVSQHLFTNTPNDALIHMLLWYFTDRQEACLQVQKSMDYLPIENGLPDGVVPPDKFQAAYRKSDDGRGYVFEYRIPYATLGVGAAGGAKVHPKAGNLVPGTLQFLWSNPNGMSTSGIDGWAYDLMDKPGFGYQDSGCWGKVIFSPKGKLPREQVEAGVAAEPKLPLTFEFDLPQDGQVTIALADENGQMVRNLLASSPRRAGRVVERWDGLDDSGHVLPAGKYTWRGLYHQGIGVEFVLSVHNSGQPPFKTDDETGGWDGDHGMPRAACAAGEKMLLSWNSAESGWGIIGTDLAGKKQWGIRQCAEYLASDGKRFFAVGGHSFYEGEEVRVFDVTDGRPLNFESGSPLLPYPEGGDKKNNTVTGLVYGAGRIYASYGLRDLVAAYDGKRGTLLATWKVPSPQRLAFLGADAGGDALAVVSQDKIVRLVAGKSEPLIGDHLDQPRGIAVDPDGTFYVANAGKLQDVSVFDKTGKFLRSIGKPGGRPRIGHYDASGMLEPGGIAIDNKGQLWVTETLDAPKRISVWNSATGEFANEFFGGSAYSTPISMDPKHPDEVYTHSVLWKIDWEKKTGRPVSTIWRALNGDSIAEVGNTLMNQFFPFTAKNGRQYAWTYQFPKGWALFMRDGDIFKPLLMMFYLEDGNPLAPWPPYALMGDIKRYPKGSYVWVDANDDQTMQHEEIKPVKHDHFHWVDKDLNLWSASACVYRTLKIDDSGRPSYDFEHPQKLPIPRSDNNPHGPMGIDPDDGGIVTMSVGANPAFTKFSPDGSKVIWRFGGIVPWVDATNLPTLRPGKLWGPTAFLGFAGDYTGLATYFGPYHLYTRDGLYVAMILRDMRDGKGLGADAIGCESFNGQLVHPDGMNRYFLLCGDQDGRILEVTGLDKVKRLPGGAYAHSEESAKLAADALAEYQRNKARNQKLVITRGKQSLEGARPVTVSPGGGRQFKASAAYDQKNLYVRYDVDSDAELANAVLDPKMIFHGGNVLDIQIATDPNAAADRKAPAPGDVRVLLTRQEGKPVGVVFRPKVSGFTGEPIVLKSPTGQESFDAIEKIEGIALEYQPRSGGFQVTVAIPLEALGWQPKPLSNIRMDLGYTFGNKTGTMAALRAYWSNNSFTANITNDVPHESRLEPAQWGVVNVE